MSINNAISQLLLYSYENGLIAKEDIAYSANLLIEALGIDSFDFKSFENEESGKPLYQILDEICDYAYKKGLLESDTVTYRDLFDTKIMGILTPRPSEVVSKFYSLYRQSPKAATEYFYDFSKKSNYIRTDRVAKDLSWRVPSEYGDIDITINLSKPEKDPKAIAAAKNLPQSGYPKCALCHENEGFCGSAAKPARQTLRQIPVRICASDWYLQYSPYVYYNEHCIFLSAEHTPMKTDRSTFLRLLTFVDFLPHYFLGANADLPIVGGSILSHDHMQGGSYSFAMDRAKIDTPLVFNGYEELECGIVKWPMSVIRINGESVERICELANKILCLWRRYIDEGSFIFCETDGTPHSTVTPIARKRDEKYELDIVLRNNITTEEHPLGVYHPHAEHHNIKKENIGLIEVCGLAILPSRLKDEMALMKDAILSGKDFSEIPKITKHKDWFCTFKENYSFTEENTVSILKTEIGNTFIRVLHDAAVFKDDDTGRAAFLRFIDFVNRH